MRPRLALLLLVVLDWSKITPSNVARLMPVRNHLLSAWQCLPPQLASVSGLGRKRRELEIRLARGLQFQIPTLYKVNWPRNPHTPKGVHPSIMGPRLVFSLGYGAMANRLEPGIHNCTSRLPQAGRVSVTVVSWSRH